MAAKNKSTRRIKTAKIADVARIAGVSVATVSRALAKPGMVEAATRARVVAAAKRLGYTPNVAARNLRARRSHMALVVVPNIGNAYFGELLRGIDAALTRRGYGLIIANLDLTATRDNSPDHEERYVDLAAAGQVDGVLLLNGYVPKGPVRTMLDTRACRSSRWASAFVAQNSRKSKSTTAPPRVWRSNIWSALATSASPICRGGCAAIWIPRAAWASATRWRGPKASNGRAITTSRPAWRRPRRCCAPSRATGRRRCSPPRTKWRSGF
ncbi:MAG: hypothetical protein C6Y20_10340 [Tagaea sp. CACIAM 22H2]|nr:hypothetical protein [Tagaea sp. CACIAM 22H2]